MRLVPVLFIAITLAFAGCFGKSNDTPPADQTPTSPTSTTPAGTTTTVSPTTSGSGTNTTTTTTPMAPKDACSDTQDFTTQSSQNPAGAGPAAKACTIDVGYTTVTLNVTWTSTAPQAPNPNGITVKFGSLSCTIPTPAAAPDKCSKTGPATPGAGKIEYSGGPAPLTVSVKVIES